MGRGSGEVSFDSGYSVWQKNQMMEQVLKGIGRVKEGLRRKVEKRVISEFEKDEKSGRLHPLTGNQDLSKVDLVIEAVFEDLDLKRNIVNEVEASSAGDTIRSEEHTSELQSRGHLVCRLLLENKT